MKYVIFAFAFCIMFVPAIVEAQSGGLVTCARGSTYDCNWCTFVEMINLLIDWLIIFLSVIAVIVMVIAGFKMVTSGGDTEAWASGKRMFTSVIIGIIIVLAGWMIIDVLLRTLTTTGGINDWIPEDCGGQLPPITGMNGGGEIIAVPGSGELTAVPAGLEIKNGACSAGVCQVETSTGEKLTVLQSQLSASGISSSQWQITEAYPPTVTHQNQCHQNGTCVDANCIGGCNASQISTFISSAQNSGLTAVYEVTTQGERQNLVNQGVPSSGIQVVPQITAPHFSVYNTQ